jgi:branched-chain amino acid transport system ATP-binding protein
MLTVSNLSVRYGQAVALLDLSFEVGERSISAVVGANGAGKSSLGKAVCGLVSAHGSVTFDGQDVSGKKSFDRVAAGMVYVPEGRMVFKQLTVLENLRAGAFTTRRKHDWERRAEEMLDRVPRLRERSKVRAAVLSGGEQQLLAVCRALMPHPKLLVLDEPSLGLAPSAVDLVADFLGQLVEEEQLSLLILEQNVAFASRLATEAIVLDLGHVAAVLDREGISDPGKARQALMSVTGKSEDDRGVVLDEADEVLDPDGLPAN